MKNTSLVLAFGVITLLLCCERREEKPEQLARQYCGSCHLYPEPGLLGKKQWREGVLPKMAFRMGMDYTELHSISADDMDEVLKSLPDKAMVTEAQWKAISDYYLSNAPDSLTQPAVEKPTQLKLFTGEEHVFKSSGMPLITLVKYDSTHRKVIVGTRLGEWLTLNTALEIEKKVQLKSPPSDVILESGGEQLVACLGVMDPNDQAKGSIIQLPAHTTLIDSIKRPVNLQYADLNNDGKNDFVVSAFGNYRGALLAYESTGQGYRSHAIHNLPGTRNTIIRDFNQDGLKDILALVTQGDEQITLFINEGSFQFTPKVLLRFSPVYGSSFFQLHDFNRDGHPDILYTNGDNADYSSVLKPYHGVRIFLNDGSDRFTEDWFYPMHGASQALASDFDQDGDLDIAAIAFFPDFKHAPENSFLYFENNGGKFTPSTTPLAARARWLVMEVADIDNDNDADILLGSLNFISGVPDPILQGWQKHPTALLLLRNRLR
jgi:hypothetical protein